MSESEDDNAIFEINDFTIVTPIEEFSAAFDGIVQKWNLCDRRPTYTFNEKFVLASKCVSHISFGENKLKCEYYQPTSLENAEKIQDVKQTDELEDDSASNSSYVLPFAVAEDIGNMKQAFGCLKGLPLQFGVRECIVITACDMNRDSIIDEDQANTLLGAIKTSLHSSRCEVPVFLRVLDMAQEVAYGYASDGVAAYNFTTANLRNFSKRHCSLSGLVSMFKEYANIDEMTVKDDMRISVRFEHEFVLNNMKYKYYPRADTLRMIPLGFHLLQPIYSINILSFWREFREDSLTENEIHSDFDINYSTHWRIFLNCLRDSDLKGVLHDVLVEKKKGIDQELKINSKQALGIAYSSQGAHGGALDKLTGIEATNLKIGSNSESHSMSDAGSLPKKLRREWILSSIFSNKSRYDYLDRELFQFFSSKYPNLIERKDQSEDFDEMFFMERNDEKLSNKSAFNFKAAAENSVAWNLATTMLNVRYMKRFGKDMDAATECQMWLEFVQRLRDKYENNEDIDKNDVSVDIDLSQCWLAQKLQLLQCCVIARRKRYALFESANDVNQDEFFDASSDFEEKNEVKPTAEKSSNDTQAQGRLKKLGDQTLLDNPEEPIFIPITQDRSPLTEDMLEEYTNYLCQLSEEERVLAQLEPLRSDMMSFKAANPGCQLGDFLRWHSPKDFNDKTGELSERMTLPGNTWLQCWETTQPVAVINQTRLFNDTKIAEEIFETFENATIGQYYEWLKPIEYVVAYERIVNTTKYCNLFTDEFEENAEKIGKILQKATQSKEDTKDLYATVSNWLRESETRINMAVQLKVLFDNAVDSMHSPKPTDETLIKTVNFIVDSQNKASKQYLSEHEDLIPDIIIKPQDPVGRAMARICGFGITPNDYREPVRKEYILMWKAKRPSQSEFELPHRMYALLEDEYKMACFSLGQDCNFNNSSYL